MSAADLSTALKRLAGQFQNVIGAAKGAAATINEVQLAPVDVLHDVVAPVPLSSAPQPQHQRPDVALSKVDVLKDADAKSAVATPQTAEIDRLTRSVEQLRDRVDAANDRFDAATSAMDELRHRSLGKVDDEVRKLSDNLQEARATLQYMLDVGSARPQEIAKQEALIAKLEVDADKAAKKQRIETYQFEHSAAYLQQKAELTAAAEDLKAKREAEAKEQDKLADLRKQLDKATSHLEDVLNAAKDRFDAIQKQILAPSSEAVKNLRDELADAEATLQNMNDQGDTRPDKIAKQQALIDKLNAQIAEAEKKDRMAQYAAEHNPEYQRRKRELEQAQAAVDHQKGKVTDQEFRVADMTKGIVDVSSTHVAAVGASVKHVAELTRLHAGAMVKTADDIARIGDGVASKVDAATRQLLDAMSRLGDVSFLIQDPTSDGFTQTTGANVLEQLQKTILDLQKVKSDPLKAPTQVGPLEDRIRVIYDFIRRLGGSAGQDLNLDQLIRYTLDQWAKDQQKPGGVFNQPPAPTKSAGVVLPKTGGSSSVSGAQSTGILP